MQSNQDSVTCKLKPHGKYSAKLANKAYCTVIKSTYIRIQRIVNISLNIYGKYMCKPVSRNCHIANYQGSETVRYTGRISYDIGKCMDE